MTYIVKRSSISEMKIALRAVCSHMRKTTLDSKVYYYRFRICANVITQKIDIDYTDTYSPVGMWSTLRATFVLSKVLGWS